MLHHGSSKNEVIIKPLHEFKIKDLKIPTHMLGNPSGDYKGSKTVVGHHINAEMDFTSTTMFDISVSASAYGESFALSAPFSCKNEPYSMSGNDIVLPSLHKQGDCVE